MMLIELLTTVLQLFLSFYIFFAFFTVRSILRHKKTDETQSSVYMNYSSFSLLRPLREDLRYDIRPERRPDRRTRRAFF